MSNDDPKAGGPAQTPPASRLSPPAANDRPAGSGQQPPRAEGSGAPAAPQQGAGTQAPAGKPAGGKQDDPLRGSKFSGFWATVVVLVIVLVLLAVFVLQNTQSVQISFLGWSGSAPLAAAMMIAAAAGLVVAVAAGSLRILQLRRRVKRDRKA